VRLYAVVADGAIATQRCAAHQRCTIAVALARADHRFARQQLVTAHGPHLLSLQSDDRGDLVLVWANDRNILYAATRAAGALRLSAPHRLSHQSVNPGTVIAAYGPRNEAIVAWSRHGRTLAAVYSQTRT
jgi:hypothetical protein